MRAPSFRQKRSSKPSAGASPAMVLAKAASMRPRSSGGQYAKGAVAPSSSCASKPSMRQKAGLTYFCTPSASTTERPAWVARSMAESIALADGRDAP